ncbi:MAG TPA: HAD family hydrolase [Mycobacteriales bacterium]|nr:HAD family hydrolase [Mycobacteriales bacterium]
MSRSGVLFDVDGTLVDSNYLHIVAWLRAFRAAGFPDVTGAQVHRCVGMGGGLLLETLIGGEDEAAKKGHSTEYERLWPELRPFPKAVELLREVRRRGGETVLATSATEEEVGALRRALDCDDAITEITSSADVEEAKPAPDIFATAMAKTGLDPERVVVVGDTRWDAEAATRAGLRCVGLRSGGIAEAELRDAGCVAVYDDAASLLASFDSSPLGTLLAPT